MRPRARPAGALAPPSPVTNGSALVIEDFGYSPAQMAYQAEVGNRAPEMVDSKGQVLTGQRGEVFYKDATPKADHYIQFRVLLPPALRDTHPEDLELDLKLCFAPSLDSDEHIEVGPGDQNHLKRCDPSRRENAPPPTDRPRLGVMLRYRVELGSYRQGDKRFSIKASLAPADDVAPALAALNGARTTPVYIASKVKRPRAQRGREDDEDDLSVSPQPAATRARTGARPPYRAAPTLPSLAPSDVADIVARIDHVEQLIFTRVVPALNRIEERLRPLDLDDDPFGPSEEPAVDAAGLSWSDAVAAMGSGFDEAKEALMVLEGA
mmetsp:Transcript_7221/g.22727  ORF Transcript_7221/g.22727 Transcript_7221/m.22727 type:complete len:323 (+) Transcript_7221:157-1125(+)